MAKYLVQHRRGTAAQWQQKNTIIPQEGEIVIEIDEENSLHKLKIGDGVHTYAELAYLQAGDEVITQTLAKTLPRIVTITLDVSQWVEVTCETDPNLGYYGQIVALDAITDRSRLDLQPSADMIAEFKDLGLVFVTENKNRTITVYSVGDMPLKSYTLQATIVETEPIDEIDKVIGIPVGTSTAKSTPSVTTTSVLEGKKIVYDGDGIAEGRSDNGGSYAKIIADLVSGTYINQAVGDARLTSAGNIVAHHSIVDNIINLPTDADLYCFEGGINDYWNNISLGTFSKSNYTDSLDIGTVCGALEYIFRFALNTFVGKPICFVITHKIQSTAYSTNLIGYTFEDYRNAMIDICQKYSIPYYDAFLESGLNGWNAIQNNEYFTSVDGIHPNEEGYKRYYVPQLITLFEKIILR